ncbi:beta-lactamase-like protein [Auriculariales sp. MPI-PUGE-AT-0066]|nr:beta-lactamase-like protein [Auriculariales sp. MPI-PUGE-AT-0066]
MRAGLSMRQLKLTFLGTCSGGGPLYNRNCTSTMLTHERSSWLIDCAEGTQHQMLKFNLAPNSIDRIFVTHMHVDHIFGLVPLLSTIMFRLIYQGDPDAIRVNLYGPAGLRQFIRSNLKATFMSLGGKYATHELLRPDDTPTPCTADVLHENEAPGRDILSSDDGTWLVVERLDGWQVAAGPLVHRVPTFGYVFTEPPQAILSPEYIAHINVISPALLPYPDRQSKGQLKHSGLIGKLIKTLQPVELLDGTIVEPPPYQLPRKVAVLGDTSDASGVAELARDCDVLVHEATNASVIRPNNRKFLSEEMVRTKAVSRGHSTPRMAAEFAKSIGAKMLVMNHFSATFPPATNNHSLQASNVIDQIERQAKEVFDPDGPRGSTIAAYDGLTIQVPVALSSEDSSERVPSTLDNDALEDLRQRNASSASRTQTSHKSRGQQPPPLHTPSSVGSSSEPSRGLFSPSMSSSSRRSAGPRRGRQSAQGEQNRQQYALGSTSSSPSMPVELSGNQGLSKAPSWFMELDELNAAADVLDDGLAESRSSAAFNHDITEPLSSLPHWADTKQRTPSSAHSQPAAPSAPDSLANIPGLTAHQSPRIRRQQRNKMRIEGHRQESDYDDWSDPPATASSAPGTSASSQPTTSRLIPNSSVLEVLETHSALSDKTSARSFGSQVIEAERTSFSTGRRVTAVHENSFLNDINARLFGSDDRLPRSSAIRKALPQRMLQHFASAPADILEEESAASSAESETPLPSSPAGSSTRIREEIIEQRDDEGNIVGRRRKVSVAGRLPIPRLPRGYDV